jgi:hypothetical protein
MKALWLSRVGAAALLLAVSTYYLLASIPFARYHFLEFAHFWWLPPFIRHHPLVMAAGVTLLLLSLPGVSKAWRLRLGLAGGIPAAWMAVVARVPALDTYENAMAMSAVPLGLCAAAAVLDVAAHPAALARSRERQAPPRELLGTAALGGLIASAIYLLTGTTVAGSGRLQIAELLLGGAATVVGHELLFMTPVVALLVLRSLAKRLAWRAGLQWIVTVACLAIVAAFLVRRIMLSTLLMREGWAFAFSIAIGLSMVLYWQALEIHRASVADAPDATGRTRWFAALSCAAVIVMCVVALPRMLLLADWGMVLQKTLVVVTWMACGLFVHFVSSRLRARVVVAVVAVVVSAASLTVRTFAAAPSTQPSAERSADIRMMLERYASVDHSLATILDVVRPAVSDRDFFTSLRDVGDVTDNPALNAVPLHIVPELREPPRHRPHIFLIVVDSLRPDYLAPYRPSAAPFTPAIGAFGRDSIVMRRAFTRYAGTALSQPAIWAGGLIPRYNYLQPFSVVNNLARLVDAAGYRQYVSMDEISKLTLNASAISNLEPQLAHPENKEEAFKFDLCHTVTELTRQLDRDAGDPRPVFVYTQPQNLHIRVLAETSRSYVGIRFGEDEYFQPAVAALQRLDACFGTLIDDLKRRGLYDDSVILLTSDHGDSYGEEGRWGHAFYLVPDTLRIPLIVHVPERLQHERPWDSNALAFSTDLTPTLFDLLGYAPAPTTSLVGRSLLHPVSGAAPALPQSYFVQSSYSRAFGVLEDDGARLYIADANHVTEALFDLRAGGTVEVQLSAVERVRYRQRMFAFLHELNAYYAPQ